MSEGEGSVGVDVGGTFTDIVLLKADGTLLIAKKLTTLEDSSEAVREGIVHILGKADLQPAQVSGYFHATTLATNLILTRTGALTGLITTKGFRDVLEIRRMRMHKLYDIKWTKPTPLVARHLRLESSARMNAVGEEIAPLDEKQLNAAIQQLLKEGVASIAVCYLHAYRNGAHERRTRELIGEADPAVYVSCSSDVLPEIKEYERTSTTVVNAYTQPTMDRYLVRLEQHLKDLGSERPLWVMGSSGGVMPSEWARQQPVLMIESGPAAGVTGAYHLASMMGVQDLLTVDMGGTTAKAALIEGGRIHYTPEYEVGGEISMGRRFGKGGGYLLRVPAIDIAEIGAGGGSIASVDKGGGLKVGPRSAGAHPGPACYNFGGLEATVTDANVHLGLTSPESLGGGALTIHPGLAEKAVQERCARPLGMDTTGAAWGIRQIANASLIRALRAVSIERGRDPRQFLLFAFGGMGAVHATDLADQMGIEKVIVPVASGVFSALGLLFAGVEYHQVQACYAKTREIDYDGVNAIMAGMSDRAGADFERQGFDPAHRSVRFSAETRYIGQDYSLNISLKSARMDPAVAAQLTEDFHREHHLTYGYRNDNEGVQIVALRCVTRGLSDGSPVPKRVKIDSEKSRNSALSRKAYFGPSIGWMNTRILGRTNLASDPVKGPLIVEEDHSLAVVPPHWQASLDQWSNIVLSRYASV